MGLLIDGRWHDQWYDTKNSGGAFVRPETQFRNWVRADGSTPFQPEAGRYHLFVSLACPWAHRTLILRKLKGLEDVIGVTVVDPLMREEGWTFPEPDPITGSTRLHEVYTKADPTYSGRVTVPVLWDRKTGTIVSNESAEIVRMLNREFDAFGDASLDFYPAELAEEIDRLNAFVYDRVNNGVYKAGFATSQEKYEQAFDALFAALDELDERLAKQRYLLGNRQTEADWRLFTTLVRFDAVYVGHFKCNLRRIADYPHLSGYLRDLYQVPGVAETVDFHHIKRHYYASHTMINPTGVVPKGPALDLDAPHERGSVG
ncbi:glutathione S-transferase family protein [Azospirillum brasilense]|uniref:Glutathione S-transferase family protein n=1 Tax=Azospirillum brasilense TaxID=192 RepID=A0A0P0EXY1_AZOBR|nr:MULTISPECIES: glutathione S-transferase family protein [Azospirillum]ALJ37359.1 glutathionyl-hydroquinone reductase YqjG [Azospirillum brasilense]MDW7552094.1 glutathione S-transferase family protein [Azospirillum brasilense]MDW7591529.1 glutathione S-transferase family protein [Azospirillum brasilense]MDW7626699.1 glutathione S-transferase family protein [Azospirillum brasilense]MDX5950952.1 glutathione S-transferase family protein [Azospirillum brasilense]